MKIYTRLEMVWDGAGYVPVREESYDCPENGIAWCKGASAEQTDLAKSQTGFYNTLQKDYATQFGNQSNILQALNASLSPIVAAGPSQFGYSAGQVDGLNSSAIQNTAQSYQNAQRALQNQQAAQGGGNAMLPSGVAAQNTAALTSAAANQTSNQLLNIQNAGYAQGNANYNNAVSGMGGVAAQYNPLGYANSSTNAGNSALTETNLVAKENNDANPWGAVGGLLGGAAGMLLGPAGAAVGSKLGSMVGGKLGGSSNMSLGDFEDQN